MPSFSKALSKRRSGNALAFDMPDTPEELRLVVLFIQVMEKPARQAVRHGQLMLRIVARCRDIVKSYSSRNPPSRNVVGSLEALVIDTAPQFYDEIGDLNDIWGLKPADNWSFRHYAFESILYQLHRSPFPRVKYDWEADLIAASRYDEYCWLVSIQTIVCEYMQYLPAFRTEQLASTLQPTAMFSEDESEIHWRMNRYTERVRAIMERWRAASGQTINEKWKEAMTDVIIFGLKLCVLFLKVIRKTPEGLNTLIPLWEDLNRAVMVVETQCTDPFPPNARISDALREATNSRTILGIPPGTAYIDSVGVHIEFMEHLRDPIANPLPSDELPALEKDLLDAYNRKLELRSETTPIVVQLVDHGGPPRPITLHAQSQDTIGVVIYLLTNPAKNLAPVTLQYITQLWSGEYDEGLRRVYGPNDPAPLPSNTRVSAVARPVVITNQEMDPFVRRVTWWLPPPTAREVKWKRWKERMARRMGLILQPGGW